MLGPEEFPHAAAFGVVAIYPREGTGCGSAIRSRMYSARTLYVFLVSSSMT